MAHVSRPPILIRDVIPDVDVVTKLLEQNAPYTPLGGWYAPGQEETTPTRAMWFQNDWVHADFAVPGSDLFMLHEEVTAAARNFYDAEVIVPHSLYVNVMAAIERYGPAHTDNPFFQGRSRVNTPMWLLRSMFWSGLFDDWAIPQATSIWWMNDVEGGGLRYWPDGPDVPPQRHAEKMANTALVGDNHGMFHQVEPVGPFDAGTRRVTGRAEFAPVPGASGDWAITDLGEVRYQAPLQDFRVSILWKAHVYRNEEDRQAREANGLSLEDVSRIFADDLASKGSDLRLDLARLDDPAQTAGFSAAYPEAKPIDAGPSVYDV